MPDNKGKQVYARRPFTYAGLELYRGEIFHLVGGANDEVLLRLRYCEEAPRFTKFYEHGATGRKFIEAGFLDAFGKAQAAGEAERLSVALAGQGFVDTTGEAELRRLNQEAPLALEKSKASQA